MEQTDNINNKYNRVEVEVRKEITITIKETIRIGTDQIAGQIEETGKTEVDPDISTILGEIILEET